MSSASTAHITDSVLSVHIGIGILDQSLGNIENLSSAKASLHRSLLLTSLDIDAADTQLRQFALARGVARNWIIGLCGNCHRYNCILELGR